VRVKVVKNKVAPPFKQAEFDIIYGEGISWEGSVLDVALERKLVQKSGSYFSYGDERLGQGRQNATAFLREHPDATENILRAIQAQLGPDAVVSSRLLPLSDGAGAKPSKSAEKTSDKRAKETADAETAARV
jgi:recombination protein RecA